MSTNSYGRRGQTGVRSPGKSTGEGIQNIKETGAGKARKGKGSGAGGTGDGSSGFGDVMGKIADEIVNTSGGNPIDVVFLLDTSSSMGDNIKGVATHLRQMTGIFNTSDIDYELGLTQFHTIPGGITKIDTNDIRVSQLTTDLVNYQRTILDVKPFKFGNENALDALSETIQQMKFRPTTSRHIVLVTDEMLNSATGLTVENIIAQCLKNEIYVTVIGESLPDLKKLATQTGGEFHEIPEDKPSVQ